MGSTIVFLKQLREGNNITQLELARRTGISSARISLAENNLGSLTDQELGALRDGIVAISKARTKRTVTESRTVQLTESSRLHSRANSKKYSDLTEAERIERRKALLLAGGASEKEASIGAEIDGYVRGVPRQFRGPKHNGH